MDKIVSKSFVCVRQDASGKSTTMKIDGQYVPELRYTSSFLLLSHKLSQYTNVEVLPIASAIGSVVPVPTIELLVNFFKEVEVFYSVDDIIGQLSKGSDPVNVKTNNVNYTFNLE